MYRNGLIETLGESFTITSLIENLNSQLTKYIRKVKRWTNSEMKSRWVAVALLEIEKRMIIVSRFDKLHLLRVALKFELKLN